MNTAASRYRAALLAEERMLVTKLSKLKEMSEWGMDKKWHQGFAKFTKSSAGMALGRSRSPGRCCCGENGSRARNAVMVCQTWMTSTMIKARVP